MDIAQAARTYRSIIDTANGWEFQDHELYMGWLATASKFATQCERTYGHSEFWWEFGTQLVNS